MSRSRRRAGPLLVALLLALPALARAETWYISNRLGMKLEGIPRFRADEFDYVLREAADGEVTVLTLYGRASKAASSDAVVSGAPAGSASSPLEGVPAGAVEVSRWERAGAAGGGVEERVYERGTHVSTALYRADGRLSHETLFADGAAAEELAYGYSGGMLRSVESRSPASGDVLWSTQYRLSPAGLLRSATRTGIEPEAAAFSFSGSRLADETLESDKHVVVLRYDGAGRRVVWEVLGKTRLLRGTYSDFDRETGKLLRERDLRGADFRVERFFDDRGNVVTEREYQGETEIATLAHRYDAEDRLVATERRGEKGIELATFGYGPDGELAWEEHRLRGALESRIVYTGRGSRYEEVVQSDRLSIRVYYEGEEKVREEVLRDGKVLRERSSSGDRP